MKAMSILRPTAWAGAVTLVLGMQVALAEPLVYVPLGGQGKIVVVDAAKDKIVKIVDTIGGVAAVHGLAETPDGRFLIAGSFEEREVGKDHAVHHPASSPSTKNDGSKKDGAVSTVSIIRTADRSIVRRIDVPGAVHHVAVGPNGRFAVVTRPNAGGISVIDLTSYEVRANLSTGSFPNYAVFSPDGGRVYVSNAGDDTVSEVDTERWVVRRNFAAGSSPEHMVPSPDGLRLYVANVDDGSVSEIATETGATLRTFDIGGPLHGIDLSENDSTLFVSALGQDKLVAIDLRTSTVRESSLAPSPFHLATVGGTGKLYVSSAGQPNIWVIDQKDLVVLGKISIGGKGHQMALSPGS